MRTSPDQEPRWTSPEEDLTERIFRAGDELVRIVLTSFLWAASSLVIVTLPAATTALFGTLHRHVVDGHRAYVADFFPVLRRSFTTVTWRGLVLLAAVLVFGLNSGYYLLGHVDTSWGRIGGGVQALACLVAVGWTLRYFDLVGTHWAREESGKAPGLRDAGRRALERPLPTLLASVAVIAVPGVLIWLSLWQFALFTAGIQAYLAVRIFHRLDG